MTPDFPTELESFLKALPLPPLREGGPPGRIDARPMFGVQAYLHRGKLFAGIGAMGLLLKLPPGRRQSLLDVGTAGPFSVQPGTTFGEWVAVPSDRWEATGVEALLALVRESLEYVGSTAPKARPLREARHFRKRMY